MSDDLIIRDSLDQSYGSCGLEIINLVLDLTYYVDVLGIVGELDVDVETVWYLIMLIKSYYLTFLSAFLTNRTIPLHIYSFKLTRLLCLTKKHILDLSSIDSISIWEVNWLGWEPRSKPFWAACLSTYAN